MIGGFEGSDLVRAFLLIWFLLVGYWLGATRTRSNIENDEAKAFDDATPPRQESIKFGPLDVPNDATVTDAKLTWPHLPRGRR